MSNPIKWWKSDKDYYSRNDPNYEPHIRRIKENDRVDNLIEGASSDGSYFVFFKKPKDV